MKGANRNVMRIWGGIIGEPYPRAENVFRYW